jgi:hypothetical protein
VRGLGVWGQRRIMVGDVMAQGLMVQWLMVQGLRVQGEWQQGARMYGEPMVEAPHLEMGTQMGNLLEEFDRHTAGYTGMGTLAEPAGEASQEVSSWEEGVVALAAEVVGMVEDEAVGMEVGTSVEVGRMTCYLRGR